MRRLLIAVLLLAIPATALAAFSLSVRGINSDTGAPISYGGPAGKAYNGFRCWLMAAHPTGAPSSNYEWGTNWNWSYGNGYAVPTSGSLTEFYYTQCTSSYCDVYWGQPYNTGRSQKHGRYYYGGGERDIITSGSGTPWRRSGGTLQVTSMTCKYPTASDLSAGRPTLAITYN